ncbi:hypothetical protein [Haloarcula sp. JP-L23]|uniref:hypothetical protein n=1 Tax=Haloarcula sp. JP-L23 TaxID=2716717 RepID=UPI00140F32FF|nr:hypothetical protein G9465_19415 [Haloarcula sp. JP-L23]
MTSTYDVTTGRIHYLALAREVVSDSYYHLPRVMAVSFVWSLLAATVVLAAPATAVAFAAGRSILDHEPFGVRAAVRAFQHYFWRAQVAFVPAFLLVNVAGWLWLRATATGDALPAVLAFLAVDVLVVYGFLLLYYGPLLVDDGLRRAVPVEDLPDRRPTAADLLRASATVAVSRVGVSVALGLFIASMGALLAFTTVGFVVLAPVLLSATLVQATRYLTGESTD